MHDMNEIEKNNSKRVVVFTTYDIAQSGTIFRECRDFNSPELYKFFLSEPLECPEGTLEEYINALGCKIDDDKRKQFEMGQKQSFFKKYNIILSEESLEKSTEFELGLQLPEEAQNDLAQFLKQLKDKRPFMSSLLKDWLSNKTIDELKDMVAHLDDTTLQKLNFRRQNWERKMTFKLFFCPTNDTNNGAYALWPLEKYCNKENWEKWYDAITEEILSLEENKNCKEIYLALHNRDLFPQHDYDFLPDPAKRDDGIVRKVLVFQHANDKAHAILNKKGSANEIVESVRELFPKDEESSQLINMEFVFEELSDALISRPINEKSLIIIAEKLKKNNDEQFNRLGEKVESLLKDYSDALLLELVQQVGTLISKRYS